MARPESEFPTIRDARAALEHLIEKGLGDLPIQLIVVPPSTMHILAKDAGHSSPKPAVMLEMFAPDGAGLGVLIASVDMLGNAGLQ